MSTATTATAPVVVEVKDVTAGYLPGVNILNGCSLVARQGELIGIIGPNGAGKSTLLKAIFGQVQVRDGSISLEGDDITNLRANKLVARGVGFVPQTNNVFPSLTIEENLEMGCYQEPKRFSERFQFVTDLFHRLGERRKQRAGSLSGGERQMVAMGRALAGFGVGLGVLMHVTLATVGLGAVVAAHPDDEHARRHRVEGARVPTLRVPASRRHAPTTW